MLPPRPVRRLVLAPLAVIVAIAVVVLSPLLVVLLGLFGLLGRSRPGGMRGLRVLYFALVWLTSETATLFMCLGLWVASGFGGRLQTEPFRARHYAIMRWLLEKLYRTATRTFGLKVEVDEPELTEEELAARLARPVIVFSRHAGPGDSFLLVRQLLSVYGRRPRVVMKATLQLDPSLDVVGNRLPNVFVQHRRTGDGVFSEQIERLASGLERLDALVIFPEGGNWTPGRWRRGIRRLEQGGREDLAARAREMPNCCRRGPAGRCRLSLPARRLTWSSWRMRGWTRWSASGMCGGACRWGTRSRRSGGGWRAGRCRGCSITRGRCGGCTTGGSASTRGSPRTGLVTPSRWRCLPAGRMFRTTQRSYRLG